MTARLAGCHCGALELVCEGEPARISLCHCSQCQRRTGSAFSVAVFYPRDQVQVTGETKTFTRDSASGFPVTFHFCPTCGSNVYWRPARMPERIGVALGAFVDPEFPAPEQSVWTKEEKHRWVVLPAGVPAHDENPPPRR